MPKMTGEYLLERRDAIVQAATRLFAQRGYAGTTMRMIAAELGASLGSLTNYFASKADIIEASSQMVADHFLGDDRLDLRPDESAVDYLARQCATAEHDVQDDVDFVRISIVTWGEALTSPDVRAAMAGVFSAVQERMRSQLIDLQKQGALPPDLDVEAASVLIHAIANGYALHSQIIGEQPTATLPRLLTALVAPRAQA